MGRRYDEVSDEMKMKIALQVVKQGDHVGVLAQGLMRRLKTAVVILQKLKASARPILARR